MGKRNMDSIDKNNNNNCCDDTSRNEQNDSNINRSEIEGEFQEPFIIEESEKQIEEGQEKPQETVTGKETSNVQTQSNQSTIKDNISNAATFLANINEIKEEIIKLPLNPAEKDYMDVYVFPLLNVLLDLSTTSLNLSSTTSKLAISYVTTPKVSKLKDTEHLVYDINDKCEDVYKVLKQRINLILKCIDKCDK